MKSVVIDAGSYSLKAGFANPYEEPTTIIPTQVKKYFANGIEKTVDAVVRGRVAYWDSMEDLLSYVLHTRLSLEIGNEGHILWTEPLSIPSKAEGRERLLQMMFEKFNVSELYLSEQPVLSLYANGLVSGCTVDIGHGKIEIAPVLQGVVQRYASKRIEFGGLQLTELLAQSLRRSNSGVNLTTSDVIKLKEHYACCAEDQTAYEKMLKSTQNKQETLQQTLPDGQVITIPRERCTVGEALFQPTSILGLKQEGIVKQLVQSISSVSSDNHPELLKNTVICGGTSSMNGFKERFQKEVTNLCSPSTRPTIVEAPGYMPNDVTKFSAWIGGAILAKVVLPETQRVTKADYAETGSSTVHRSFFQSYPSLLNDSTQGQRA